ncbi:MAG: hypothetical protein AAGC46_02270, partial [Solirubrobacteraceae bacterium]|nr:hypothetical protein [Patulibacter sp.]
MAFGHRTRPRIGTAPRAAAALRPCAGALVTAAAVALTGCGTPKESETAGSATDACAPLVAIKADATKILAATPASTSPKGSTPSAAPIPTAPESAAQAISALSHRIGPVADALDKVASAAGTQSGSEQHQVTGLLTAELALRRVALALAQRTFTE